jgi:hypothetical protein
MMDGLIVSGGVARGPQDGPNVHHGLSLMSQLFDVTTDSVCKDHSKFNLFQTIF